MQIDLQATTTFQIQFNFHDKNAAKTILKTIRTSSITSNRQITNSEHINSNNQILMADKQKHAIPKLATTKSSWYINAPLFPSAGRFVWVKEKYMKTTRSATDIVTWPENRNTLEHINNEVFSANSYISISSITMRNIILVAVASAASQGGSGSTVDHKEFFVPDREGTNIIVKQL